MNYALIGCGRISPNHLAAAQANNLNIIGLCDIDKEAMTDKALKFKLQDAKQYSDYKQMLQELKPDLVSICTESGKHEEIALYCIEQGIHLIIEKPIALSIEGADRIIKASQEHGVKVCACHQNRFNKSVVKIREAVEHNRFGKMFYGTAHIRWNR